MINQFNEISSEELLTRLNNDNTKIIDVKIGLDCHTMAAFAPPIATDRGKKRPAACVSNANAACDTSLMLLFAEILEDLIQQKVAVNNPFMGGYIIRKHSVEIPWLQIEFSRSPFMTNDEKRLALFETVIKWLEISGL